jgi:hypothetical protein
MSAAESPAAAKGGKARNILDMNWLAVAVQALGRNVLITLLATSPVLGQGHHDRDHGRLWPDDLALRTLTGTVLIDSSLHHPAYLLDEDQDAEADIHLSFGPWWYKPATGITRPEEGDTVTVVGIDRQIDGAQSIIVFELNGVSWRQPNEYGMQGWNAMPFWLSSDDTVTVAGLVLIDTTYFYDHFYLDTDNDSIPEYQLMLGPEWYRPPSGAKHPEPGDSVTVFGAIHETRFASILVVYRLDGLVWRQVEGPADWSGTWMERGHADTVMAYCVNDSSSWVAFPPNHMTMGGMMWPDSMFVQFWRVPHDSLPGERQEGGFAGFYINVHSPEGSSMMGHGRGGRGGRMSFSGIHDIRFHYGETMDHVGEQDGIQVLAWNEDAHEWTSLVSADVDVDAATQTVTVTSRDLSKYYLVAPAGASVGIEEPALNGFPAGTEMDQNYPNPFASFTKISFVITERAHIVLSVHDVLGRKVATLIDGPTRAGRHEVFFDGAGHPSGTYFYRVSDGARSLSRPMLLLK